MKKSLATVINGIKCWVESLVPKKLSDIENDLFYVKKEHFVTLTEADFSPVSDDGFIAVYQGVGKLDWLTDSTSIICEFSATFLDNDESISESHDICGYEKLNQTDAALYSEDFPIEILTGFNPGDDTTGNDAHYITIYEIPLVFKTFTITLYRRIDEKKIPGELVDTSDVENRIANTHYNDMDEVWSVINEKANKTDIKTEIIVPARKVNSSTYGVTISNFTIEVGKMITIIPDVTLTGQGLKLKVNNGTDYGIRLYSMMNVAAENKEANSDIINVYNCSYLQKGKPTTLQFNGLHWVVQNVHVLNGYDLLRANAYGFQTTCNTASDQQVKDLTVDIYMFTGQTLILTFTNGNTAEYPKIKFSLKEHNIIDAFGNPIQTLALEPGTTCVFIQTNDGLLKLF